MKGERILIHVCYIMGQPEDTELSEISLPQEDKYLSVPFICGI